MNSDVAYDYIRKRILSGEFPPGYALMTEALSARIKISRTPVRDALRQLEADGLVVIRPHAGARVKTMDLREFRELCELRLALESHAAALAARNRTLADLEEIGFTLKYLRDLTNQVRGLEDGEALMAQLRSEDIRFHLAVIGAAKNDLIKREILRLHLINRVMSGADREDRAAPEVRRADRDAHCAEVLDMHERIFQAIERGDAEAARTVMGFHIQDIVDRTIQGMTRASHHYLAARFTEEELSYKI
ncbi:MAG: GntR family transcriptional regulator [Opitutaceae bacterium]|nr:GntR family transcriptional regulator [Opitutaceae bacterium]